MFATHNEGKIAEMRKILVDLPIEVVSAREAGVREEPTEDVTTFEENAIKKARFVAERTNEWSVADDSGICIDALGGRPGVLSARWAGEGAGDKDIETCTLAALQGVPAAKRTARFVSSVALAAPDGRLWTFNGEVAGTVAETPRGLPRRKLPYDTIFIPSRGNRTFAEMTDAEKNKISHRGLAFAKLKKFILKFLRTLE